VLDSSMSILNQCLLSKGDDDLDDMWNEELDEQINDQGGQSVSLTQKLHFKP
jgi:hypothetical protein